jgi:serine/threonine-protein kinase RsbW
MPELHTLLVSGGKAGFERSAAELTALLEQCPASARARFRAEVIFEEVVTNVIRHAYGDDDTRQIEIQLECDDDSIRFVFMDDGPAFDPLARPDPPLPASLDEAREGGLGILLVRKMAAHVGYERAGGRNQLTVTLAASPSP